MRNFLPSIVTAIVIFTSGCAGPAPEYRNAATVKDIMDSIVDPNADFIWDSVSTSVTAKGIEEKAPKTDDDWKELRRHTIALMEATDLLQIPGRPVAKPGEKAENPQVELSPEVIKTLIDSDRRAWIDFNHGLHDATAKILLAVDKKDVAGVLDAGDGIDKACENCHKQYWYPERAKK
jgi:hypothetical protein